MKILFFFMFVFFITEVWVTRNFLLALEVKEKKCLTSKKLSRNFMTNQHFFHDWIEILRIEKTQRFIFSMFAWKLTINLTTEKKSRQFKPVFSCCDWLEIKLNFIDSLWKYWVFILNEWFLDYERRKKSWMLENRY